ncbi:MAG: cysteine dioxygenase, partial [Pseudonocardiaceae bacterium]
WYQRFEHTADGQDFGGEVWLISWPSGTQTGLHDHGGSPGAFVVVDGELTEQTIAGAGTDTPRLRNHTKTPGRPRMFGAYHLHNVGNVSPGHALSVHVYTPALTSMSRYAWTPRGAEAVSIDRVGQDW